MRAKIRILLYPTKDQKRRIENVYNHTCDVFNYMLSKQKRLPPNTSKQRRRDLAYTSFEQFLKENHIDKKLGYLTTDIEALYCIRKMILQQIEDEPNKLFGMKYRRKNLKYFSYVTERYGYKNFEIGSGTVSIPNIGKVRADAFVEFPNVKELKVRCFSNGKYFVEFESFSKGWKYSPGLTAAAK